MKVFELYKSVAQLGFEDSLEEDERFFYAANRALLQVCKLKPVVSHYMLNHNPLKNIITKSTFAPIERSGNLIFETIGAKAYYFEADGNGNAYIEKKNPNNNAWDIIKRIVLTSTGNFIPYKGFIKDGADFVAGSVRIRFAGEYLYSVRNVAMYEHLRSANESDIPAYEPFTRYNIRELTTDFLSLCSPPIQEDDEYRILNQEYRMEGDSVILLPYDKRGVYKVLYEKRPRVVVNNGSAFEDETIIDLDEELCSLLPTLIAAYVWVDDEPAKSEYYLSLYRERAAEIERRKVNTKPVAYKNSNGW